MAFCTASGVKAPAAPLLKVSGVAHPRAASPLPPARPWLALGGAGSLPQWVMLFLAGKAGPLACCRAWRAFFLAHVFYVILFWQLGEGGAGWSWPVKIATGGAGASAAAAYIRWLMPWLEAKMRVPVLALWRGYPDDGRRRHRSARPPIGLVSARRPDVHRVRRHPRAPAVLPPGGGARRRSCRVLRGLVPVFLRAGGDHARPAPAGRPRTGLSPFTVARRMWRRWPG